MIAPPVRFNGPKTQKLIAAGSIWSFTIIETKSILFLTHYGFYWLEYKWKADRVAGIKFEVILFKMTWIRCLEKVGLFTMSAVTSSFVVIVCCATLSSNFGTHFIAWATFRLQRVCRFFLQTVGFSLHVYCRTFLLHPEFKPFLVGQQKRSWW